ncbi:type II toxin-antitoxin system HicB family antitoxin [Candidatus Woesebacteria bacterium]|nr:MAG: type II toxin-antitoxin system HicB family antitoxin [Candidatus Woesebacteria bacterium]
MQKSVLNYRVIIEPEKYPDGNKVYNAYCPTLGIADYGDSIEEVMQSIKDGIELAIETLGKEGKEIPIDNVEEQIVTSAKVKIPSKYKAAFA